MRHKIQYPNDWAILILIKSLVISDESYGFVLNWNDLFAKQLIIFNIYTVANAIASIRAYIIIKRAVVVVIIQSSGQQTHINIIDDGQHLHRVAINGRNSVKSLIITRIQQQALAIDRHVTSSDIYSIGIGTGTVQHSWFDAVNEENLSSESMSEKVD